MKLKMILVAAVLLSVVNVGVADTFGTGANEFTIDFVDISGDSDDLGDWAAGDGYTFSGVNRSDYRMGKYEISNDQFSKFDPNNNLWWEGDDIPSNMVSWFEAAQFVNYLNSSTGNQVAYKFSGDVMSVWQDGDTGYDASNPYRNSNAKYFMPTEDEWVKAAYWNGTALQTYATKAGESLTQGNGASGTGWNYYTTRYATTPEGPWNVGSGSEELNGTYDMMGNVREWMESPDGDYLSVSNRIYRGGAFSFDAINLSSSYRGIISYSDYEHSQTGFRVASVVVVPCDYILAGDLNDDCKCDLKDFAMMAANWMTDCNENPILAGDLYDDCKIDLKDFSIMAANWMTDCNANPSDPNCVLK